MDIIYFPEKIAFNNHLNDALLHVVRADALPITKPTRVQVASICNQTLVYEALFRASFGDLPYSEKDAQDFLEWAHEGWNSGSHFVFLLINKHHRVVGALDIKSANFTAAEIGYWASVDYPGNVTNALIAMLEAAAETGFSRFTAYIRKGNDKSARVLQRAGFQLTKDLEDRQDFIFLEHLQT
jgi:RimJ/RimL family protein N-acetyltransferase